MKNQFLAILFLLSFIPVFPQKTIEKEFEHSNRYVELQVPFASDIKIKTWDKSTVYFKATLDMEDDKYLDLYKLDIGESPTSITITSKTKEIFKAFEAERKRNKARGKSYYTYGLEYEFDYVLYVPKDSKFKVSSINGDMSSEIIEGDFEAELINGDIDIKQYSGNLDLSTINGEIDLMVNGVAFVAETINGNIYADEALKLKVFDKRVGEKVKSALASGPTKLALNTINGNMYLRL